VEQNQWYRATLVQIGDLKKNGHAVASRPTAGQLVRGLSDRLSVG